MRLTYLSIPAGLAFAFAGAALYVVSKEPHSSTGPLLDPNVRHFVTQLMMEETAARARKEAPAMTATDSEGKSIKIGGKDKERPQFVYFVLDGCPCSYDAEPLFHKLFKKFKGKVDFVSVTNGTKKQAHEWSTQLLVNYPVVPDPEKTIIHAYKAKASVYSTLVSTDGHIIKMWPGYSADFLREMNAEMSKAANVPLTPFDPEYAPKTRATGCAF